MNRGYIKKESRKKILLLGDDLRVHSGVATICKELVISTSHVYNWVQIAGAVKHPDGGKKLDLSAEINKVANIDDASLMLYPTDGYGNPDLLRAIIKIEKPDVLCFITDPRYYTWLFQMEAEVRKQIPMVYINIWDDLPVPLYNSEFYESCDGLFGISKQTVLINKLCLDNSGVEYKEI